MSASETYIKLSADFKVGVVMDVQGMNSKRKRIPCAAEFESLPSSKRPCPANRLRPLSAQVSEIASSAFAPTSFGLARAKSLSATLSTVLKEEATTISSTTVSGLSSSESNATVAVALSPKEKCFDTIAHLGKAFPDLKPLCGSIQQYITPQMEGAEQTILAPLQFLESSVKPERQFIFDYLQEVLLLFEQFSKAPSMADFNFWKERTLQYKKRITDFEKAVVGVDLTEMTTDTTRIVEDLNAESALLRWKLEKETSLSDPLSSIAYDDKWFENAITALSAEFAKSSALTLPRMLSSIIVSKAGRFSLGGVAVAERLFNLSWRSETQYRYVKRALQSLYANEVRAFLGKVSKGRLLVELFFYAPAEFEIPALASLFAVNSWLYLTHPLAYLQWLNDILQTGCLQNAGDLKVIFGLVFKIADDYPIPSVLLQLWQQQLFLSDNRLKGIEVSPRYPFFQTLQAELTKLCQALSASAREALTQDWSAALQASLFLVWNPDVRALSSLHFSRCVQILPDKRVRVSYQRGSVEVYCEVPPENVPAVQQFLARRRCWMIREEGTAAALTAAALKKLLKRIYKELEARFAAEAGFAALAATLDNLDGEAMLKAAGTACVQAGQTAATAAQLYGLLDTEGYCCPDHFAESVLAAGLPHAYQWHKDSLVKIERLLPLMYETLFAHASARKRLSERLDTTLIVLKKRKILFTPDNPLFRDFCPTLLVDSAKKWVEKIKQQIDDKAKKFAEASFSKESQKAFWQRVQQAIPIAKEWPRNGMLLNDATLEGFVRLAKPPSSKDEVLVEKILFEQSSSQPASYWEEQIPTVLEDIDCLALPHEISGAISSLAAGAAALLHSQKQRSLSLYEVSRLVLEMIRQSKQYVDADLLQIKLFETIRLPQYLPLGEFSGSKGERRRLYIGWSFLRMQQALFEGAIGCMPLMLKPEVQQRLLSNIQFFV